ncbi:hypothetical protein GCM10010236_54410 [Streptomyces eurythermus]|nr:hypothetical protein GCM10010236_54410 [Streptomyces eurythermus]
MAVALATERAGVVGVPSAACTAGAVCTARAASAATETAVTELRRAQGRLVIGGGPLTSGRASVRVLKVRGMI